MILRPTLSWLRQRASSRDERGSATLELVIIFPVMLLLIFGIIQGALYFHARAVALAAAQEGLRSARVENGTASNGAARAQQFLDRAGNGLLTAIAIRPSRTADTASITVRGQALSLAPGLPGLQVSQTAAGPVEKLTGSGQP